jgi:hypothetical protein
MNPGLSKGESGGDAMFLRVGYPNIIIINIIIITVRFSRVFLTERIIV